MWGLRQPAFQLATSLKGTEFDSFRTLNIKDKRSRISICVIDDNQFEPKRNLENSGYRISFLGDVNAIDAVTAHHIVLCDLQGVGTALDERKQGAFLIKEIKKNFPEKYVVAYTGGGMQQGIAREAALSADVFLKKDADIEQWVETLDRLIAQLLSPYQVWQRQRMALVEREVDSLTILRLENAFVASILKDKGPGDSPFEKYLNSGDLSGDVRGVLQGMISSGLYALLFS